MILFTKKGCTKCDFLKSKVDIKSLGVNEEELGPDNSEALADLAWHGLVSVAEKQLPILVLDDSTYLTEVVPILRYLNEKESV